MEKPYYQFDDSDQSLPIWRVKCQNVCAREARHPFFKESYIVRADNRRSAIYKVLFYFGVETRDCFTASKIK